LNSNEKGAVMSETRETVSPQKQDLIMTRVFDVPVEEAWKAWTEPQYVMRWWGPDHFTCPSARINFQEGQSSIVCMRAPKEFGGQDFYGTWTYTRIVPLQRIEYIHTLSDKDGNEIDPGSMGLPPDFPQGQRNVVAFKTVGDNRTEVTVTQFDWTPGSMMEMGKMGLSQSLGKLAAIFGGSK
jgi:uncharacterized protein YndB with AHSA1/START domain